MLFRRSRYTQDYGLAAQGVVFDPMTLTVGSLAATAAGGSMSAMGTLAGGEYAKQAGLMQQQNAEYQAKQAESNATQAIAAGQRKAADTNLQTKLAISTARASAGASGVDVGSGSPATAQGELAQRGSYHALMDMFNGQSKATGLENEAAGMRYSGEAAKIGGEMQQKASYLSAAGTLAGSAGSMFANYGKINFPTSRGSAGASL